MNCATATNLANNLACLLHEVPEKRGKVSPSMRVFPLLNLAITRLAN
jgi:hypothetical protein